MSTETEFPPAIFTRFEKVVDLLLIQLLSPRHDTCTTLARPLILQISLESRLHKCRLLREQQSSRNIQFHNSAVHLIHDVLTKLTLKLPDNQAVQFTSTISTLHGSIV